jgi:hypothetical protein
MSQNDLAEGSLYWRELEDGRAVSVWRMMFNLRICIGPSDLPCFDDGWCYARELGAAHVIALATAWDGSGDPPAGWHKHVTTGRRRVNGDPAQEYVAR